MFRVMYGGVRATGARATLGGFGLLRSGSAADYKRDDSRAQRVKPGEKQDAFGNASGLDTLSARCS